MKRVDVERIRIRVKGPAAGWTPAAAAALGERVARALAARGGLPTGSTALGAVDAGTVRAAGGPTAAAQGRAADAVASSVASAAQRGGR
jgi:hypothetical protein